MERYELYSQRQKRLSGELDFFVYDKLLQKFRNQMLYIIKDFFYREQEKIDEYRLWKMIYEAFLREQGLRFLCEEGETDDSDRTLYLTCIENYLKMCSDACAIDLTELIFFATNYFVGQQATKSFFEVINAQWNETIALLNLRFQQNALGYEFVNGYLVRKDSQFLHAETVKPALVLLHESQFQGAEKEFFAACQHRLSARNEECIDFALKSLESVIKTICDSFKIEYDKERDGASKLIGHLKDSKFLSDNPEINGWIASTMTQELPSLRNKLGGHGDGKEHIPVADAFADYALHLAATNIVFLVDLFKQKTKQP